MGFATVLVVALVLCRHAKCLWLRFQLQLECLTVTLQLAFCCPALQRLQGDIRLRAPAEAVTLMLKASNMCMQATAGLSRPFAKSSSKKPGVAVKPILAAFDPGNSDDD